MRELYAVIPTRGDRDDTLGPLLRALRGDAVTTVVVWTVDGMPTGVTATSGVRWTIDTRPPRNIQRWWNLGLQLAASMAGPNPYAVAVLNDDLDIPPRFVSTLAAALDATGTAIAHPDRFGNLPDGQQVVWRHPHGTPPAHRAHRMPGYAFVIAGEEQLRADEGYTWWFGDDDLERRAIAGRGTVRVGGLPMKHHHPDGHMDAELAAAVHRDRNRYLVQWGAR